jgi:hypothetical protein
MNLPQVLNDPLFDLFWSKYPNKVGKIQAQKAWKKLAPSREDTVQILETLARQKESRMWKEGFGIPHPSTYLNQARFLDEPIVEGEVEMKALAWWATNDLMLAKGKEFGMSPRPGEVWQDFKGRLSAKIAEHG